MMNFSKTEAGASEVNNFMVALATADLAHDDDIAAIARYHLRARGKLIRARLVLACSGALEIDHHDAIAIAASCELLHNASLVHDDLQDRDRLRRDQLAVWARFGDDMAVLVGDYFLSLAYVALAHIDNRAAEASMLRLMHTRIAEAISGQASDLGGSIADLDDYQAMIGRKSGALLSLPLEMPLVYAGYENAQDRAHAGALAFASGYQILDDLDDREAASASGTNIINVLKRTRPDTDPYQYAMMLAKTKLCKARDFALDLPKDAGGCLADLAQGYLDRCVFKLAA